MRPGLLRQQGTLRVCRPKCAAGGQLRTGCSCHAANLPGSASHPCTTTCGSAGYAQSASICASLASMPCSPAAAGPHSLPGCCPQPTAGQAGICRCQARWRPPCAGPGRSAAATGAGVKSGNAVVAGAAAVCMHGGCLHVQPGCSGWLPMHQHAVEPAVAALQTPARRLPGYGGKAAEAFQRREDHSSWKRAGLG